MGWDINKRFDSISAPEIKNLLIVWPEFKEKQCMLYGKFDRCVNVAQFIVGLRNGEAMDVCRDCLPVACERNDEVVVMKLKRRDS